MRMPVEPPGRLKKASRSMSSDGIDAMKRQGKVDRAPKSPTRSISNDGITALRRGVKTTTQRIGENGKFTSLNDSSKKLASPLSRSAHPSHHTNQLIEKKESKPLSKKGTSNQLHVPRSATMNAVTSLEQKRNTLKAVEATSTIKKASAKTLDQIADKDETDAGKLKLSDHSQPKTFKKADEESVGQHTSFAHKLQSFQKSIETASVARHNTTGGSFIASDHQPKSFRIPKSTDQLRATDHETKSLQTPNKVLRSVGRLSASHHKTRVHQATETPKRVGQLGSNESAPKSSAPQSQTTLEAILATRKAKIECKTKITIEVKLTDPVDKNVTDTVDVETEVEELEEEAENHTEIDYVDNEIEIEEEVDIQKEVLHTKEQYSVDEDFTEELISDEEDGPEEFTEVSFDEEEIEEASISAQRTNFAHVENKKSPYQTTKYNQSHIESRREEGVAVLPESSHSEGHPSSRCSVRPSLVDKGPLSSVSCHLPSSSQPRPESDASLQPAPPPPPIEISRKIRQFIKSLENSFMLTQDDAVKLFADIHKVIQGNRTKQLEFGAGKGNPGFLKVLRKYEEHLPVLEAGFLVIAELANIETNRDALALDGCIEFVLIAMLAHEKGLVLQERGCYALAGFAKTRKYQEWIVASSGIQVIVTTQSAFKSNVKIQTACLCALHNLARENKENVFSITAKGGVRSLMDIVKLPDHAKELDFQMEACAIMATLSRTNDSNRGAIAAAGGIETTLKAMQTFPEHPDLQAVGLDALYCLSVGHSQNCDSIVAKRGIDMLLQKMKIYESHLRLQESSMRFARLLTESSTITKSFVASGGIKTVLVAMRRFEGSDIIQDNGCATLLNMAMEQENKDTICGSGGIGIIVMAMKKLSENTVVQKNGCKALERLATNEQNKKSIAAGGGITAIMAAMKTHEKSPALAALAVSALRRLASVGRNRTTMTKNGCIEAVERAMKSNPNNTFLHNNGDALLLILDPSRENNN